MADDRNFSQLAILVGPRQHNANERFVESINWTLLDTDGSMKPNNVWRHFDVTDLDRLRECDSLQ